MPIDVEAYLRRIDYAGPLEVDLATLRALQRAHLMAVPYEGFDIQLGRRVPFDAVAALDKIVRGGRGGWCYEMNGAFGLVLEALGFKVSRRAGDVTFPHMHLVLTVELDEEAYICELGLVDGPAEPFRLVEGPFSQDGYTFRIAFESDGRWRFHNHRFWLVQSFVAREPDEDAMAARADWLQVAPESPFVGVAIASRRTPDAIMTLLDRTLRTTTPEGVSTAVIDDARDFRAALLTHFGLDLPEAEGLWPAICARHEARARAAAAKLSRAEGPAA